jgi:adenine-specific DNA-methyltransferase
MTAVEQRAQLQEALHAFGKLSLHAAAIQLWATLGYRSSRTLRFDSKQEFLEHFARDRNLNIDRALYSEWQDAQFLFQLTDAELGSVGVDQLTFTGQGKFEDASYESFLFLAVRLARENYARGSLATIAREVNKLFLAPAIILFVHGNLVTVAVVDRRRHKRDDTKDVLEKVTLIKGIDVRRPHRAHVEILHDLSITQLYERTPFTNFVGLHRAWAKALDSSELNKRFFIDVANWFFWASRHAKFPRPPEIRNVDAYQSLSLIRLLTRVIFCWFLKEKSLIPDELFDASRLREILINLDPKESTFYRAILQNLFFATLSVPMDERRFIGREFQGKNHDYGKQYVYRFKDHLRHPEQMRELFGNVPFLNGGLFECLDLTPTKEESDIKEVRIDGFSSNPKKQATVPNFLFFGEPHPEDLRRSYGDELRFSQVTVRPLIETFNSYKFTIAENTPVEEEIALDPELLGLVFENLLASFNPETKTTARKQTGAFYTPRVVVDYMIDEALIAHFREALGDAPDAESRLKELFRYSDNENPFTPRETSQLLNAIDSGESTIKILDPACGSGAFPMGILHRLVFLLRRLDPGNAAWRERQLARVRSLDVGREAAEKAVKEAFARDEDDYARKVYLIENCIYGVDINPIAVQIAKLRFFISLLVDQETSEKRENRGVLPLPNLETKFVAANTLFALHRRGQTLLVSRAVREKIAELLRVRHDHFNARYWKDKRVLRRKDKKLREEIATLLRRDQIVPAAEADQLAEWDPYAPNEFADFFDPEWMFALDAARLSKPASSTLRGNLALINEAGGQSELIPQEKPIESGFDIVIGNPPYVRMEQIKELKPMLKQQYHCFTGGADLYVYFYERSFDLLRVGGLLSFISSNKFLRTAYAQRLRHFLATAGEVKDLIDFGETPVFTAIVEPSIILVRKIRETRDKGTLLDPPKRMEHWSEQVPNSKAKVLTWEIGPPLSELPTVFAEKSFYIPQNRLLPEAWRLQSPSLSSLLDKVCRAGRSLEEFVGGRFFYGIKTGLNEAFLISRETRDDLIRTDDSSRKLLKPFLRGRDVGRWRVQFTDQYLIRIESSENRTHPWSHAKTAKQAENMFAETYPAVHGWFEEFRSALIKRQDQGRFFWELRSCAYWEEFERPKLLYMEINRMDAYSWDDSGMLMNNKLFMLPDVSLIVLACLNSMVGKWAVHQLLGVPMGGFLELQWPRFSRFPVANADKVTARLLIKRVEKILALKKENSHAFVAGIEAEIDGLVAHLYGLSESEFKTILAEVAPPDPARVAAADAYRDAGKGLLK